MLHLQSNYKEAGGRAFFRALQPPTVMDLCTCARQNSMTENPLVSLFVDRRDAGERWPLIQQGRLLHQQNGFHFYSLRQPNIIPHV